DACSRTRSCARSGVSTVQVGGVAMPARSRQKLVIDLSTQRSIARASLYTHTPSSRSACSTPRRTVTCSNVPAAMVRTKAPSGSVSPKPGRIRPCALAVARPQPRSDRTSTRAPRATSALPSRRVCQSGSSTKSATLRGGAERRVEERGIQRSRSEAATALERSHGHERRTEQQPIHLVEVALVGLEDLRERTTVVARACARQLVGELLRVVVGAGDVELHVAAVD